MPICLGDLVKYIIESIKSDIRFQDLPKSPIKQSLAPAPSFHSISQSQTISLLGSPPLILFITKNLVILQSIFSQPVYKHHLFLNRIIVTISYHKGIYSNP